MSAATALSAASAAFVSATPCATSAATLAVLARPACVVAVTAIAVAVAALVSASSISARFGTICAPTAFMPPSEFCAACSRSTLLATTSIVVRLSATFFTLSYADPISLFTAMSGLSNELYLFIQILFLLHLYSSYHPQSLHPYLMPDYMQPGI